jgi:hypothetical protein
MADRLRGKVGVITGGTSGIGLYEDYSCTGQTVEIGLRSPPAVAL